MHTSGKAVGPLEWFLLLILSVLWGGSFFFSKVALGELRPFTIVLGRVVVAAIPLNIVIAATGHFTGSRSRMPIRSDTSSWIRWRLAMRIASRFHASGSGSQLPSCRIRATRTVARGSNGLTAGKGSAVCPRIRARSVAKNATFAMASKERRCDPVAPA